MEKVSSIKSSTSIAIFLLSIAWFRRKRNKFETEEFDEYRNNISARGVAALKKGSPYWESFLRVLQNPCDPQSNPVATTEGGIALCVAENKLMQEVLASRLMQQGTAITAFSDSTSYCHGSFLGLPQAREAAAYFLSKRFWKRHHDTGFGRGDGNSTYDSHLYMSPEYIAFGAGVNSLISQLFYSIASPGDVVLIPAPYYAGFEYDAKAIAGLEVHPVYAKNPVIGPSPTDLENAARSVEKQGKRVKILLLTNPNDPLGVIYKPEVMKSVIEWARKRQLHTIVDEIFALSTHQHPDQFQSIIKILDNQLGVDVHFLWGLSKDFGATGFRFAMVYTQNIQLLQALANLNIFSGVPNPMQMIVAELLIDDEFVDSFLEESRFRLVSSYNICVHKLDEMVVPFVHAEAGIFVYVDFSSLLPEQSFEGEAKFAALIEDVACIVMTPGHSQRDCKPGMFRLCYSWVSPDVLKIAMERLSYVVLQIRRHRWDDLLAGSWRNEATKCGTHLSTRRTTTSNLSELVP